jgi:hypothetical protein
MAPLFDQDLCMQSVEKMAQKAHGKKPHLFCPAHRMPHRESEVRCIDPRHKRWRARSQFDGFCSERNPGGGPHDVHECRHHVQQFAQLASTNKMFTCPSTFQTNEPKPHIATELCGLCRTFKTNPKPPAQAPWTIDATKRRRGMHAARTDNPLTACIIFA